MLTRLFPAVAAAQAYLVDAFATANRKATSPANAMFAAGVAALVLLAAPITSAEAAGMRIIRCFGSSVGFTCTTRWGAIDPYVVEVPGPRDAQEEAEFRERDRNWVERCRPVIKQDRYGVGRYHYAAPGCEFGRIAD